ncbi:MAG: NAD(P)H-dependent glycerol-3-phosphate dehydrogenase [Planctomycetota bacterium]
MTRKIAVIGAGGWGTATGGLLAEKGFDVSMLAHEADHLAEIERTGRNDRFLEGYVLPERLRVTLDAKECLAGADTVLSVVPTKYLRRTWRRIAGRVEAGAPVVSLTKGIEPRTLERPTEILAEYLPDHPLAVLSGPSHAEEVARHLPTTVTVASRSTKVARRLQEDFGTNSFRVYTNRDVFGVEFGGAMKNVIAIAAGVLDGLELGDNTKAALLTRGLAEIVALGTHLGAKRHTLYGMSGMGDLITTAFSPFGRNRAVGERIGRGEKLADILASSVKVAEGVPTTRSVRDLARREGIEMPITEQVYLALYKGKDPRRAIEDLMQRRGKSE